MFIFCYAFSADERSNFCKNDINHVVPFLSDVDRVVHETNTNVMKVNGTKVFDDQQIRVECDGGNEFLDTISNIIEEGMKI